MARKTNQTRVKYKTRQTKSHVVKESRTEYVTPPVSREVILTEHPHIVRIPGVQNGDAIIRDAVVTVHHIAILANRFGQTPEQIAKEWSSYLSLAQIHDALSYYYDHKKEIDDIIAEEDRIEARAIRRFRYREQQKRKRDNAGKNGSRN